MKSDRDRRIEAIRRHVGAEKLEFAPVRSPDDPKGRIMVEVHGYGSLDPADHSRDYWFFAGYLEQIERDITKGDSSEDHVF